MKILRTLTGFCLIIKGMLLLATVPTVPSTTTATVVPTRFAPVVAGTAHKPQAFLILGFRVLIPLGASPATASPGLRPQPPNLKTQIQILLHTNVPG